MISGNSWTSYNWQRDGLIPGASALLESLWAYAWISFLFATSEDNPTARLPYIWIFGLLAAPAVMGRLLERGSHVPERLRQFGLTVVVLGMFAGFMYLYHDLTSSWLVGVVLLSRGVWLALGDVTSDQAPGWFLAGLGAFLGLLAIQLVAHANAYQADLQSLGPVVVLYLFAGLGWLALVRQQELQEESARKPVQRLDRAWLLMLFAISAVLLAIAATASSAGKPLLLAVEQLLLVVLGAIWAGAKALVLWMSPFLTWLFSHMPTPNFRRGGGGGGRQRLPDGSFDSRLLDWLQLHIPPQVLIAVLSVMMMILLGVWLAIRYRGRRDAGADEEERTSIWSWRLFWQQLRQAMRGVRLPLRGSEAAAEEAAAAPLPASSIRQMYTQVLRWSRERGQPRRPGQTPLEFEPALDEQLSPSLAEALTSAYVQVRYGETEPPPERVQQLADAWQEVRTRPPEPAATTEQ